MKNIFYALFLALLVVTPMVSCGSDDEETDDILTVVTVDLSDFTVYAGSVNGGVEVQFNDLKRTDLAMRFFESKYDYRLNDTVSIQFNNERMTYTYRQSGVTRKIVSTYQLKEDSLFINKSDGEKVFVALKTDDNIYRMKGLSRYRLNETEDIIRASDEVLSLDKMLQVRGFSSLKDMTDPTDTIAWCNATYIFK